MPLACAGPLNVSRVSAITGRIGEAKAQLDRARAQGALVSVHARDAITAAEDALRAAG